MCAPPITKGYSSALITLDLCTILFDYSTIRDMLQILNTEYLSQMVRTSSLHTGRTN